MKRKIKETKREKRREAQRKTVWEKQKKRKDYEHLCGTYLHRQLVLTDV